MYKTKIKRNKKAGCTITILQTEDYQIKNYLGYTLISKSCFASFKKKYNSFIHSFKKKGKEKKTFYS